MTPESLGAGGVAWIESADELAERAARRAEHLRRGVDVREAFRRGYRHEGGCPVQHSTSAPHSATISAVITRADGTVEHVGVVAAGYSNPLRQWWWDNVGRRLSERRIRQINERHGRA